MKRTRVIFVLAGVLLAVVATGCSSSGSVTEQASEKSASQQLSEIPEWYVNPPAGDDVIYGVGSAESMNRQIARRQAVIQAQTRIAQHLESKIEAVQLNELTDLTGTNENAVRDYFGRVVRTLTNQELVGSQIKESAIQSRRGGKLFEAYILMSLPKEMAREQVTRACRASGDLFELIEESEEYKRLLDTITMPTKPDTDS